MMYGKNPQYDANYARNRFKYVASPGDIFVASCSTSNSGASDRYTIFGNAVHFNTQGTVSDGGSGSNKTVSANY